MSKITITPDGAGTGTFSIASPNSNTNRTLTLPDSTGELLNAESSLNAAKLTGALPAIDASNVTGIVIPPVFAPVAVTGTTPSLDVGSYNYFDNGTLTGNTTVSFASVPTNARWTYTHIAGQGTGYDIANAAYTGKNFNVNSQETNIKGMAISTDGLNLYGIGPSQDTVFQYPLSIAWDISTASYLQGYSVNSRQTNPEGIAFKTDGTEMYIVGNGSGGIVQQFTLSTAWDVSTSTFTGEIGINSTAPYARGVEFKPDGTEMYVVDQDDDAIHQYTLSTAWLVSTATFTREIASVAADTNPQDIRFKPDGLAMFVVSSVPTSTIREYTLTTAWNISTATYTRVIDVSSTGETGTSGLALSADGTLLYFNGGGTNAVYQYTSAIQYTNTFPAAVTNPPLLSVEAGKRSVYEFVTLDAGVTVTLIGEEIV